MVGKQEENLEENIMKRNKPFILVVKGRKTRGARKTILGTAGMGTKRSEMKLTFYKKMGWKDLEVKKKYYTPQRIR